ncbi:MAG: YfhO family protein [Candidatus Levybacteria bacterium]|nr:YfhO family protein [Candidatus Levybacteria bacterium]
MKLKFIILFFVFIIVSLFFKDLAVKGNFPIPSDTIVGLYHPYRDFYAKDYSRGMPFKNSLITDPVRQQYPWKELVISLEKNLQLPLWNPYNFSGTPHLANFQSGSFSLFNVLFFLLPFSFAWSLTIFLQPLLIAIFTFLYLDNLRLNRKASILGAFSFAFCGFSVAWLEWGNILTTALWLPLILLAIDKINTAGSLKLKWSIVFIFSLLASFFAGHIQIFMYLFVTSILYLIFRFFEKNKNLKKLIWFVVLWTIFVIISAIQWIPSLQFIFLSAREADQANWMIDGWFIPLQNIVQFLVPDFFGNPATLNYFGVFNYGEFIGYIGVISLILALFAIVFKRDREVAFFTILLIIAFIFAFPNIISKLPYKLSLPFLSTSQPTRLIFIIDFSLSVLAAFGLDLFLKEKGFKKIFLVLSFFAFIFGGLWLFVVTGGFNFISAENLSVIKRNLIFPSTLFVISAGLLITYLLRDKLKLNKKIIEYFPYLIIALLVFDLFRFGWKFLPFTNQQFLYPKTATINFLLENIDNYRIMETDARILPPNFSLIYKIQSVDGYDPLYLQRYGEFIAALGRDKPDISQPFGFNRIVTPQNYNSPLVDLLGVKYILSFKEIEEDGFVKAFQEGTTLVYENMRSFARVFFVGETIKASNKQEAMELLYEDIPLDKRAVLEDSLNENLSRKWSVGKVSLENYSENEIVIKTQNEDEGFLVLTDSFYPTWHAKIDGKKTEIYLTDYNFRGIIVPNGNHTVVFYNTLY